MAIYVITTLLEGSLITKNRAGAAGMYIEHSSINKDNSNLIVVDYKHGYLCYHYTIGGTTERRSS